MPEQDTSLDITTFLLSAIHDMKNSVGVLSATLESAVGEMSATEQASHPGFAQAYYEAQRLNDHLMQLLTLYKLDRHYYPFDPTDEDMGEFAEEALARVQLVAWQRHVLLEARVEPGLIGFFDHELVLDAVLQALHNGILYSRDRVRLIASQHEGMLELRVEDNGKGYPAFMLEHEIEPAGGVRFATGSTGLGLYFSAVIARLHRNHGRSGQARLENGGSLGGGCFVLTLP